MARHRVDSSTIAELIRELDRITALSEHLIAEAQDAEQGLAATWSGDGHAQYTALQAEWSAGADAMRKAAAAITDRAKTAASNYDASADHSKAVWG